MNQEFDEPERPWTEEQWLAEFRRNDARSAKFGELMETFADDPDCDEKINHEMGWNKDDEIERPWLDEFNAAAAEIAGELEEERLFQGESDDDESDDDPDEFDDATDLSADDAGLSDDAADLSDGISGETAADDDDDDGAPPRSRRRMRDEDDPDHGSLPNIPAYALGMDLAVEAVKLAKGFPEESWQSDDHHELFCEAVGNTFIPAAKIAGGHSYGYDTNICGNIVCNRIALEAVEKSISNFAELEAAGTLPQVFRDKVVPRVRELQQLIVDRIATMRKRVWW